MKFIYFVLFIFLFSASAQSQFLSYVDPAAAYNKLMLDQSERSSTYDLIGRYKVQGTPYLFGETTGDVFGSDNTASKNINFRYNTYSQTLEIVTNEKGQYITKKLEEINSFTMIVTDASFFKSNLNFISGTLLDSSKNNFMQVVSLGKNVNLYKAYYTSLGVVSTNYVQSELRKYELLFEYYYSNPNKFAGLKKIKVSRKWIEKEFAGYNIQELASNDKSQNSENYLKRIFARINE